MNRKKILFILAAVFFLSVFSMPAYCNEKPTCVVLMFFPDVDSTRMSETERFSAQYAELLGRLGLFEVLDYQTVARMIQEKNVTDLKIPCTSKDCALNVGRLLNVDYAVYGVIGHIGKLYSLETTLVNIDRGTEAQYAVTDYEGTQQGFEATAPAENIKSLFGVNNIPQAKETMQSGTEQISGAAAPIAADVETAKAPTAEEVHPIKTEKNLFITPRIGMGATDDSVEFGGGLEVQYKHLSCGFLMGADGYTGALSYYLKPNTSSPFLAFTGTYYDTENHGVDEIGRIYGLMLGYRLNINDHLNARLGLGAGYVNWDQTELNKNNTKDNDEEYIPVFEVSLGYSFGLGSKSTPPAPVTTVSTYPMEISKTDSDADGVYDADDACPETPAGASVDAKGCPLDTDNDGVPNNIDQCPNTPTGAKVDARGCWVIPGIAFNTDQSTLNDENAKSILDAVIIVMNNLPDRRYEIQGYTDNVGSAMYNQELSEKRAFSVKNYLIKNGISSDRLTTKGFGL